MPRRFTAITSVSILLIVATFTSMPARADWQPGGTVICEADGERYAPTVAADGADGIYLAWTDRRDAISQIYLQHLDVDGVALWPENGVPVDATADNESARLVAADDGGVFVTWRAGSYLVTRRWDVAGDPVWPAPVRHKLGGTGQAGYDVAADGAGGLIAVWHEMGYIDDRGVYAQRLDADGNRLWGDDSVRVCGEDGEPRICADGAGGAFLAWADRRIMPHLDIYAQHLNAAGEPQWEAAGRPVCQVAYTQNSAAVVTDGAGGVIVLWREYEQEPHGVYAQRYAADGSRLWPQDGVVALGRDLGDAGFAAASDHAGGAIVVWSCERDGDRDLLAQRLDGDGQAVWLGGGKLVCGAAGDQTDPRLAVDAEGESGVIWQDKRRGCLDIFGQKLDADGFASWQADGVWVAVFDYQQVEPRIALGGPEDFYAAWMDDRGEAPTLYLLPVGYGGSGVSEECLHGVPVPDVPLAMRLEPNRPNPFNPRTTIPFELGDDTMVRLAVFDARGRLVRVLLDERLPAGRHATVWNGRDARGRDLPSGRYLYRLETGGGVASRAMVLVR